VGSLLKYLLYHRQRRIPREELIDLYWPEADPELARNRLNVAVSHVRQVFRNHIEGEVVVYQEGKYSLSSKLDFWTDLSEFERNLEEAWRDTQAGKPESAIRCLEVAANLYQGDFLADDRYEEWTIFTRERVRLAYLDALVQLAHHYFNSRQHAACAALCQSILERDPCREDIHCLLMRCYARQDQFHLGLRQYQTCVEVLDRELEIEPAEATQLLYRRLQRREHTRPGMA
jgi:DNA-binding SARP family transcriptional activator